MIEEKIAHGVHDYLSPEDYVEPDILEVKQNLKAFTGYKLGFMMHWMPGSQIGTYESWPLSDGDGVWSQEDLTWDTIENCKKDYLETNKTFNPIKFNPEHWAELAAECGFKYLLFTTKHHDGFCMFDTKTTNYKITDESCPFHKNKNADIVRALYEAFRAKGLAISTYFSKPDWHSNYYWNDDFGTAKTRNVNYDIAEHPELWEKYIEFCHEQIRELTTNYGKIDCLWLDGGWVNKDNLHQDFKLGDIVSEIRNTTQPHMLVCDRMCGGEFENFITPEQTVPKQAINVPWETCITIGDAFSFRYADDYKTGRELVHLLLDVVSKGGNLALNIAPQPDGLLPTKAVKSIKDMGAWLKIYGEGIYGTSLSAPYFEKNLRYTRKEDAQYAFYLFEDSDTLPKTFDITVIGGEVKSVTSLRSGDEIRFRQTENTVTLYMANLHTANSFIAEGFKIILK